MAIIVSAGFFFDPFLRIRWGELFEAVKIGKLSIMLGAIPTLRADAFGSMGGVHYAAKARILSICLIQWRR